MIILVLKVDRITNLMIVFIVDGGWSDWSSWTECDGRRCSGVNGFRIKSRSCSEPAPKYGGHMCQGDGVLRQKCYSTDETCPGKYR